jgi:hypothetical protein
MSPEEREAIRKETAPVYLTDAKIKATSLIPEHRNFEVDASMYNGMTETPKINDYVQLGDHEDDQDDIVPEFSYDVKPAEEQRMVEQKHVDFQGDEFKETYDE